MNWLVDGLPAAQEMEDREGKRFYQAGFALGKHDSSKPEAIPFMNNHYEVIIYYHEKDTARVRVVGVIVHPKRLQFHIFVHIAMKHSSPP